MRLCFIQTTTQIIAGFKRQTSEWKSLMWADPELLYNCHSQFPSLCCMFSSNQLCIDLDSGLTQSSVANDRFCDRLWVTWSNVQCRCRLMPAAIQSNYTCPHLSLYFFLNFYSVLILNICTLFLMWPTLLFHCCFHSRTSASCWHRSSYRR